MLGFKLNHVIKRGHRYFPWMIMVLEITGYWTVHSTACPKNENFILLIFCEGNPSTGRSPSQRDSNVESISVSWYHHFPSCSRTPLDIMIRVMKILVQKEISYETAGVSYTLTRLIWYDESPPVAYAPTLVFCAVEWWKRLTLCYHIRYRVEPRYI